MKKMKKIFFGLSITILLSSCSLTVPYTITNNAIGAKTGVSSTISIFSGGGRRAAHLAPLAGNGKVIYHGIILNSDFGILEAAKNGKISKIGAIDFKITTYLFFTKQEFIVSGE